MAATVTNVLCFESHNVKYSDVTFHSCAQTNMAPFKEALLKLSPLMKSNLRLPAQCCYDCSFPYIVII